MNMNNNKSPGYDNIPNRLIKILFNNNKSYVVDLFNYIINLSDLRPITLINGFCKIAEALYAIRIEGELNANDYFSDKQYGFCRGKSTVDAAKKVVDDIKCAKKFRYAVAIAFDASSAFDTLNHTTVIDNALKANLDTTYIKMLQSLLVNRTIQLDDKMYKSTTG